MMSKHKPFVSLAPPLELVRFLMRKKRLVLLKLIKRESFTYGDNVVIGPTAKIHHNVKVRIKSDVAIGGDFLCQTHADIGEQCLLSSRVSFVGNDHDIFNGLSAYFSGVGTPSTIVLEGNNFIGFGTTVCGNVKIGKGAFIGACSLVIGDVPANTLVAGVPAKHIRDI